MKRINDDFITSLVSSLLLLTATVVSAAETFYVSSVAELKDALAWVRNGNSPAEIRVASGTYLITEPLRIWTGTTLTLDDGATMKYTGGGDDPFLRGSHFDQYGDPCYETSGSCPHGGYGQCREVTVQGGTWDRNSSKSANSNVFIFRHASGITIRNMTVKNCSNHYFNLSGSENILVSGVVFSSAVKYTGSSSEFWGKFAKGDTDRYKTIEAIHLDALTKTGEPSAYPVDGTPCRNVEIVDCDFVNVFAGAGTHHVSEGAYASGLTIRNCSFEGLQSFAVYCFGYEDMVVADNDVIGGAGLLIAEDSSCTARGNTASGGNHNTIQIGNGSNATISGNTLKNAGMAAVRVLGASTAIVNNNKVLKPATMGLSAAERSVLKASGNTITSAGQHGVYVNAASAVLSGNKIVSPAQAGIRGDLQATISASGNTISSAGTYGITMGRASKLVATGNSITSPKKYGIILESCVASSINENSIQSAGSVGIRLNKTKGSTVSRNKVANTAAGCDGILLDTCETGTVSGNTVSKTGGFGIRILGTQSIPATVAVTGNTVSTGAAASGYADIRLGDWCRKCTVSGNVLANKEFTISNTGTSGNKYAPAATKFVSVVRSSDAKMVVTWKKQKAVTGYQLQWADNKKFKKAKTASICNPKTVSKAISGLSKKKRYWIRIRTFDTLSGKLAFSSWSPVFTALPAWASGTFTGHVVVSGAPGTATMKIANTGAVSGSFLIGRSSSSFSAADLTSWNGKAFTVKFQVKVGSKTWKPSFKISPVSGAQKIGVAKSSATGFVSEMSQNIALLSASGQLSALVGKTFAFSEATAGAGLSPGDTLSISFANGDSIKWQGIIGGVSVSGTSPCAMQSAKTSGTSVVYTAKIPVCIPSIAYNRLAVCKIKRAKSGTCTVKWTFQSF